MVAVLEAESSLLVGNVPSHPRDYQTELQYRVVKVLHKPLYLADRWIEEAMNAFDEASDPGQ